MHRYTDTNKWNDPWFIELSPCQKLLFNYLCDNCDNAGFFELSMKKFRDNLHGFDDETIKESFRNLEKSYIFSKDRKVIFIKNFCKHQKNIPLNPRNNAHAGIIAIIQKYKSQFSEDIIKIINKDAKNKKIPKNEGVVRVLNGMFNIPFADFWNLYGFKVGDGRECEKKWNFINPETQQKIIETLPFWKKTILLIQPSLPYPETYLNQQRWNDEIPQKIDTNTKKTKKYIDYYSEAYEVTLSPDEKKEYWKLLSELGYLPKKTNQGFIVWYRPGPAVNSC